MQKIKTQGKAFEALQKTLKKENAKFKKLTRAQQRVAIAEDVIAQVKAKKFIANSTYFDWAESVDSDTVENAKEAGLDLSECVSQVKCEVCGIGSLFMSGVRKADNLKINQFNTWDARSEAVEYLEKWFDSDQLDLVEDYYERNGGLVPDEWYVDYDDSCSPIYRQDDDDKRLMMIMANIASNNGKFDPKKGKYKIDRDPAGSDE